MEDLTAKINNYMENLEFATARIFIEENTNLLKEHKNMLNKNARELLNFLLEIQKDGYKPLTRRELAVINAINKYATKFDLRGLKVMVKEHPNLLLGNEILSYLNTDAKIILEGMGAISK